MKRKLLIGMLISIVLPAISQTLVKQEVVKEKVDVYQLPNGDFEGEWNEVTSGKVTGYEPQGWHSFISNTGSFASTARAVQLESSTEIRPGSTGITSAKIFARKVIFSIIAQGNLTTGRINAGSMTASDASGNYNYSEPEEPDFNQPFSGRPDSLRVWVKFVPKKATDRARISAVIHGNSRYQDPEAEDANYNNVVARAQVNYNATSEKDWQLMNIPFIYEENSVVPAYVLATFTTNETPGKGSAEDYVLVDDVEMIYNSRLNDLQYNDVSIEGFNKEIMDYEVVGDYEEGCLTAIADGRGASVSISYDENTAVATISVKGDNFSEDSDNYHEYKVSFLQQKYSLTFDIAEGAVITPSIIDAEVKEGEDYTFTVSTPASNIKPYVTIGGEELGKNEGEEWEYTISSITSDLTVKIELVTYHTLVFDVAEGIVLEPLVTIIEVEESESYTFYMTFDENYDNYIPAVTVNGNSVAIVEGDDVWSYTLSGIVENYDIVIGKQEVSGVQVNNLKLLIRGGKGILEVDTDEVLNIAVFNVTGQIVVQRTINGYDNIPLGRGIYIVRAGEKVYKVAIE